MYPFPTVKLGAIYFIFLGSRGSKKRIFGWANPLHRNKAGVSPAGRSRFLRGSPGVLFHIYTDACVNKNYHGSNELGDVQQTSNGI